MGDVTNRDVDAASARVAIAKAKVDALDEAIRSLRLQRKAADAIHTQRLSEFTTMLIALKDERRTKLAAAAGAEGGEGQA